MPHDREQPRPGIVVAPKLQTMGATDVTAEAGVEENKPDNSSKAVANGKTASAKTD